MHLFREVGWQHCHAGLFRCISQIICCFIGDTLSPCICMFSGYFGCHLGATRMDWFEWWWLVRGGRWNEAGERGSAAFAPRPRTL